MAKAILVVESNPVSPEREDEFNDWYTNTHLDDVVAVPGFGSATRYVISDVETNSDSKVHRYLAIYELETEDVAAAAAALAEAVAGGMPVSDSLNRDRLVHYYVPIEGAERAAGS